jgi:hypothetical protein
MIHLSHSNFWLHNMLTSEGACTHEHVASEITDAIGTLVVEPTTWDEYTSESHFIIVDHSGLIVYMQLIDWDLVRFAEDTEWESSDITLP